MIFKMKEFSPAERRLRRSNEEIADFRSAQTVAQVKIAGMRDVFDLLIPLALAAVATTLGVGVYSLFRGGEFSRKWSNKLMRLRVALQFCAILVLVAAFIWRSSAR